MMRRFLLSALLLAGPATGYADGLPGAGYPLDTPMTWTGCAENGSSCHQFTAHLALVPGTRHTYLFYDSLVSVWLNGSTDLWYQMGVFTGLSDPAVGTCYANYTGVAGATAITQATEGACERPGGVVDPKRYEPPEEIGMTIVMRPLSVDYETHRITMRFTTTPEPNTIVMIGTGLLMLAGIGLRLRQHCDGVQGSDLAR